MVFLKKLHKWVGLLIGIQVLLWLTSGLMISLLDPAKVSGAKWARPAARAVPLPVENLLEPDELAVDLTRGALSIELKTTSGQAVYEIIRAGGASLINASTGLLLGFSRQDAKTLAQRDFSGDGGIDSIEKGMAPDMETRDHSGPYWRVNFKDAADTSYYISAGTGEILERRNNHWRTRDVFWMLHIMDYSGREDFNNALIITVSLTAIWLGISGFLLLFCSFNRHEFNFLRVWRKRDEVLVTLITTTTGDPRVIRLKRNSNLFLSLAGKNIDLPSICGGGGECGKCRVKIGSAKLFAANAIEQALVPKPLREQGYRLACQYEIKGNITVYI